MEPSGADDLFGAIILLVLFLWAAGGKKPRSRSFTYTVRTREEGKG